MVTWLKKLFCWHKWQKFCVTNYTTRDGILFLCKKCDKLKVKKA